MSASRQRMMIDELHTLAHPRDGHPKVFAMIDSHLDESGIHDGAKVCLIAGYFGDFQAMRKLEQKWKKTLSKHHFAMEDFHAKDLIKHKSRLPMLLDLAQAISECKKVFPVSWGLIVDDFNSFSLKQRKFMTGARISARPPHKFETSGCPSKPYFVPFQNIIKIVTDNTPIAERAHFSFGIDREFSEYALAFFKQIERLAQAEKQAPHSTWKSHKRLGDIHFPVAANTAQLQAADLLAHLTYLHMREKTLEEPVPYAHYSSVLVPCRANTKNPLHHVYQRKQDLQKTLDKLPLHVRDWVND